MTTDKSRTFQEIPAGEYDAETIEQALAVLPPDMYDAVVGALKVASKERGTSREVQLLQTTIAEFAIALHLLVANQGGGMHVADLINWERHARDLAEAITIQYKPEIENKMPDTVRKAVAYFHAGAELVRLGTRDEIDQRLERFGYPTDKIIDDLAAQKAGSDHGDEYKVLRKYFEDNLEPTDLFAHHRELEWEMRQELLALDYKLPELKPDKTYGFTDEESESSPEITKDMLPG